MFTTSATGTFTWSINASLKNAKGILFSFRDTTTMGAIFYNLSNRTSLMILEAQLSVGQYTFPANRYLLYDNSVLVDGYDNTSSTYDGYVNQINFWMSAMKFFGLGIDRKSGCSTNRTQFNQWYNPIVGVAGPTPCNNDTFVLAFNLEGLHDSDDEFRSCMPLDGNTTTITFQTGLNSAGTTLCDCFIMYEFDVVISQGVAVATNKYNDFSNENLK